MSKFLYVTDQDEYTDHSFIGPLFQKYLNRHFEINTIFFSKFKTEIEIKDDARIIVPEKFSTNLLEELDKKGISIKDYAFVVVRNNITLLKDVLKKKIKYNYKVGFRLSFPKRIAKLQTDEANHKKSFFDIINNKIQTFSEISLINECDIFLPTSFQMKKDYFKDVKTRTFVIPSAIDPDVLHQNIQHEGSEKRFFYAGTLDKLREFETVLEAFSNIPSDNYKLMISTKDPEYLDDMLSKFPDLRKNIEICDAKTREDLLKLIALADVGLSVLPDIALFNSSTPIKILDYYSSAVPCIMSNNENNASIFEDNNSAWFSDFTEESIREKVEQIIKLPKEDVALVGINGQKRLLAVRNYERIAADLAHQLNIL
ncbi:glycosyltransferase [bacterium]|jgi:glycosyltransferase involved in cell wall biosynthesis|nr:glycosyltransferase [bacterium]